MKREAPARRFVADEKSARTRGGLRDVLIRARASSATRRFRTSRLVTLVCYFMKKTCYARKRANKRDPYPKLREPRSPCAFERGRGTG